MSKTFTWCLDRNKLKTFGKQVFCVDECGNKAWWLNGKLHRVDGPAVEYANGDKCWYLNDKLHRENGPAIEYADGDKCWYLNDKLHRENGPAIEYADGGIDWWYLNGIEYSESAYWKELNK